MAVIIRGSRKNEQVRITDVDGEFAVLDDGKKIRLGMLQMSGSEQARIVAEFAESETFVLYYDLSWFLQTGRFKKHHWARV